MGKRWLRSVSDDLNYVQQALRTDEWNSIHTYKFINDIIYRSVLYNME